MYIRICYHIVIYIHTISLLLLKNNLLSFPFHLYQMLCQSSLQMLRYFTRYVKTLTCQQRDKRVQLTKVWIKKPSVMASSYKLTHFIVLLRVTYNKSGLIYSQRQLWHLT